MRSMRFCVRVRARWCHLVVCAAQGPAELSCGSFLAAGTFPLVVLGTENLQNRCFSMHFHLRNTICEDWEARELGLGQAIHFSSTAKTLRASLEPSGRGGLPSALRLAAGNP